MERFSETRFTDRKEAGRKLGERLVETMGPAAYEALVLAIPRGGVEVGFEIAHLLSAQLDLVIPRKLGAPDNPELAIGALMEEGNPLLNEEIITLLRIPPTFVEEQVVKERKEIKRRLNLYRGDRSLPDPSGRPVIIVDDGMATGFTVLAALRALREKGPDSLTLAVPVAPPETVRKLAYEVECLEVLLIPESFSAVGNYYVDFEQTSDRRVIALLETSWAPKQL